MSPGGTAADGDDTDGTPARALRPWRLLQVTVLASVAYGVADFVFSWNPLAAAPYLAHRAEPAFRARPLLELGVLAEGLNGAAAALAFLLVERALRGSPWRRGLAFGVVMWGFWVISGTFSAAVWLAVPASLVLANLAFGLPKCLALGCAVAWAWRWRRPRGA